MTDLAEEAMPLLIRQAESAMAGTVICAAVIAAGAGHTESIRSLELAIVVTVGAYWLVHLYAAALALIIHQGCRPLAALRMAAQHTWLSAAASLLPVAVLVLADLLGAGLPTSATIALVATIGLLALYGGIAGRRAGLTTTGIIVSGAVGACLGLVLVLVKAAVH